MGNVCYSKIKLSSKGVYFKIHWAEEKQICQISEWKKGKSNIISDGTVRAPVFGRYQFFGTSEHYEKAHGSLLYR